MLKSYARKFGVWAGCLILAGVLTGCAGHTETVVVNHPPRLDLFPYKPIGVIAFTDNAVPSLGQYATEQFQNRIHAAQTGLPLLYLGSQSEVLSSVGMRELNFEAYRKIGERYNVAAVFSGDLTYEEIDTDFNLKSIADLKADVSQVLHATLAVRLYETQSGASVWSDSARWKRKLSTMNFNTEQGVSVDADGYRDAYRQLIPDMIEDVTRVFRSYSTREKIRREP